MSADTTTGPAVDPGPVPVGLYQATTATDSVYEIDHRPDDGILRVRRVTGVAAPTPYVGQDGQWQDALRVTVAWDSTLWIQWDDDRNTRTSHVVTFTAHTGDDQ